MTEFFRDLNPKDFKFTDVVIGGGDGLLYQYIEAINKSKHAAIFKKIPVCMLPCGSWNAYSCDSHGRVENHAATNLLRGTTYP